MENPEMILVSSGRRVAVHRLSEGNGQRTVVFCHAAPGSGAFDPDPDETARRQVTLIAVDRPGYGASDPLSSDEWATVSLAADDLAEVLAKMGVGPVGAAGWSAGGRVALALAARHPKMVDRVAILSTPAPDDQVSWIPAEQKQALEFLATLAPAEAHRQLQEQIGAMLPPHPSREAVLALLGSGPADEAALADPAVADRLVHMLEVAFAQGSVGLAADLLGYTLRPWGFNPGDVQQKTLCLYGAQDSITDSRHGTWWQKNLADARLEMVPGAGHLLATVLWSRVLSHLAPHGR